MYLEQGQRDKIQAAKNTTGYPFLPLPLHQLMYQVITPPSLKPHNSVLSTTTTTACSEKRQITQHRRGVILMNTLHPVISSESVSYASYCLT